MRNTDYFVQGWMVHELNLRGYELIVFAIIYGYTQDGHQKYLVDYDYIRNALGDTKADVGKILSSLVEKECIGKDEKINRYGITIKEYYSIVHV